MAVGHRALSITIAFAVLLLNLQKCNGRFHYHRHNRNRRHHKHSYYTGNQISVPPAALPGEPPATNDDRGSNYSFEPPPPMISPAEPPNASEHGSHDAGSQLPPAFSPAQPPVNDNGRKNDSSELLPVFCPAQPPVHNSGRKNYSSELPPATSPAQPPNTRNAGGSNDSFQFPPVLTPGQPPSTRKAGGNNDSSELPPVTSPAQPPITSKHGSDNASSQQPPANSKHDSENSGSQLPPVTSPAQPPITSKHGSDNASSQQPPATFPAEPPANSKNDSENSGFQLPPVTSPAQPPITSKHGSDNASSQQPPATFPAEPPENSKHDSENSGSQLPPAISPAEPPTTRKSSGNNESSQQPPGTFPAEPPENSKHDSENSGSQLPPAISPAEPPTTRKSSGNNDGSQQPPATFPDEPPATSKHGSKNPGSQLPPVASPAEPPTTNTGGSNNYSFKLPPVVSPAEPPNTSKHGSTNSGSQLPPATSPAKPPTPGKHGSNTSSSGPCVFDVRSFGALGDGSSDDTKAFRAAWKAACAADSGVLLVPSDGVFMITSTIFSGPCKIGLVLQMDGVLMPPDGPDCWPATDSRKQWLVFYKVDGMTLTGEGTIEGNGEDWWSLPCKPHRGPHGSTLPGPCDSPALIRFFLSYNVTVRGLRIENSPQFHIKFDGCEGVHIEELSIRSPALSPNTDGIHIENTKSVSIHNSIISNGDDCISIGPGCSNVDIANVSCGPSHGISIGSLGVHNSQACVSNVTVRGARIRNSDNGVRIKTWQGGTGSVSGISFENIHMENVRNCIIIDQYYCMTKQCLNQTSAVRVTGVSYANIKGTYDVRSPPVHFACSDAVACTNITMAEVELLPHEGVVVDDPFCWNAYGVTETLTIPPVYCLQEGQPQSLQESAGFGCSS